MAGASFFALFDDIAALLDDVAVMSKVALRKTAGVLGDDLALNAQQVTGVPVNRELPVVWAVAKGSLLNKCILVPAALLISVFAPWLITPLLMIGGAYLCYEGFHKIFHALTHRKGDEQADRAERTRALKDPEVDMVAFERTKIKGAIRTDFILSAEIIAISLAAASDGTLVEQALVLSGIALLITVGVYGLVAGIVKLDDLGLYLVRKPAAALQAIGRGLVASAPYLMRTLSIVGTAAMFMVGGSILTHGLAPVHHLIEQWTHAAGAGLWAAVLPTAVSAAFGIVAGGVVLAVVSLAKRMIRPRHAH